jgi:hypothetical protein
MTNNKIDLKVVSPQAPHEFNVTFKVKLLEGADGPWGVEVITDAPVEELEAASALGEIVDFTKNIIDILNDGREALKDGTALNVTDTFNKKD